MKPSVVPVLMIGLLVLSGVSLERAIGQTFVRVTDNVLASDTGSATYAGASWIDFDNDGDLDCYINNTLLYRNDGGGVFTNIPTNLGQGQPITVSIIGHGNSWADYDNDGDLDCYIASGTSFLYRNDGGGTFTKITTGTIGNGAASPGWACAWADYNNDGYVDLAVTNPVGFSPTPTPNHLFLNNGPPDFTFTRITTGPIVTGTSTYTVGSWSDFDQDGDMDYFIGAGPVNFPGPNFLYRNMLHETGTASFERITTGTIALDTLTDGQLFNWIDCDNDGDLDAYLTSYSGGTAGLPNRLYRHDGDSFTQIAAGAIVTNVGLSLSSVWGDFDNDGDLDVYVTNDGPQADRYYRNNGDGTFTSVSNVLTQAITHRGATAGDYDNDGDLDILAIGPGSARALYRNDTENGNHWLKVHCIGTMSNRAAIGARVEAVATIGGMRIQQLREISAQNTFNGHNSLDPHFGLGNATVIDSLVIAWPSGLREVLTGVPADETLAVTEGMTTGVGGSADELATGFSLSQNYPNPFNPATNIEFHIAKPGFVSLTVFNLLGQEVRTIVSETLPAGSHRAQFDATGLPTGVYVYRLAVNGTSASHRMMVLR